MPTARRIMIIGPSGAGKSTLARAIGARLGLTVTHLDALFWQPGWVASDPVAFEARIAAVAADDAWVLDGNYGARNFQLRLTRADTIIWLDLPRRVYFWRTVWRQLSHYGRERGDVGPGCPERFELAFYRDWVRTYPWRERPQHLAVMANLSPAARGIVLRSTRDVTRFIDGLPATLAI